MNNSNRLQYLFDQYYEGAITNEEKQELARLINVSDDESLSNLLKENWGKSAESISVFNDDESQIILRKILGSSSQSTPVISIFNKAWFRIAAAAVLILVAGASYLLLNKTTKVQPIAGNQKPVVNDIAPGGNKAVLTLADGSTIILDSAANGTITKQGNTKVLKLDNGQLAYNTLNEKPTEVLYNTITTPRGGQYQLTLSDGSKVWLNAASSLRYPANFVGNERKVELTGEGYFEVAKNAAMPFKVNVAGKGEVEVLGTHFNINSYADEATINTTLLEGKVKLTPVINSQLTTQNSQTLSPGEQAQLTINGEINLNKNINIEEVVAWKNGKFIFENADIKAIMRQLERWYDIEVTFNGSITAEEFVGIISRNVNVSQILKMLEKAGTVKFEIEGKKIIVK